ncbi:hypothetical protein CY35_08G114100 [Sphagnum magellanicum]|nr:hypothetical protein CY35_08G114100 [Sphagnum magellanicum]
MRSEDFVMHKFGVFLWELISRQPQAKHGEGSHLVKAILEDSGNMGNISPTLRSTFPTETIMKIVRIIHFCLQPNHVLQRTMSDVIDEINAALQLEEGLKAEEDAMKIEIPQYASQSKTCASLDTTLEKIKWQTIFDEKSTSDCDPKGKRPQQPQTSTTQSHGSRSSEGDSMCSSSDDEMPSTSKNESLSPQLQLRATITSIEGVPNLPTTSSSSTMVVRRKNIGGNVELLFENAENMSQVVGVGLEWAKVVITKKLDVVVRHIGEHAWEDLWANLEMADFELMNIISLPELQTHEERPSNILLEDLTERFGVGLTSNDVISVYMEDQVGQSNDEGFAPLVMNLAECMGVEAATVTKRRPVSGGEGGSSKGAAGGGSSKEASTRTQDPPQDPPEDPPQDPAQNPPDDHNQDPPNDPAEDPPDDPAEDPPDDPAADPPEPLEKKKVHVVTIFPGHGRVHQVSNVPQQDDPINEACIEPILRFEFELRGNHRKITTELKTHCDLGEGGVLNGTPSNLGYFQDNITISLTCEKARAATLSSSKVEHVKVAKKTITNNNCKGRAQVKLLYLGFKLEEVVVELQRQVIQLLMRWKLSVWVVDFVCIQCNVQEVWLTTFLIQK